MTKKIKYSLILIPIVIIIGIFYSFFLRTHMNYNLSDLSSQTISYNSQNDNHSLLPMSSNQWYSSVYKVFPTQPLFAVPLAYKISPLGLSFSFPDIVKTPNTIFGSYNSDFTIGGSELLSQPQVTQIGDWDIHLRMSSSINPKHAISFFLAHGVPYTIIHTTTNDIVIHFNFSPQIISKNDKNALIKINNHYYLFVVQKASLWVVENNTIRLNDQPSLFVGLLDKPDHKDLFLSAAQSDLIGTKATYLIDNTNVETNFLINVSQGSPLIALYPHQFNNLLHPVKILGKYQTLRGSLDLVQANLFTTTIPLITPNEKFPKLKNSPTELVDQVNNDINSYIHAGPPNSKDYYLGTWFGKGTTLLQLADTLDQQNSKQKLLSYITPLFVASLKNFSYQKSTTSFVATHPEFGNEQNNDHHFHYGYYIRTASVLAMYNPSIILKLKPVINNMVLDIANTDKQSSRYPYLRNFDIYESHSWADGFANFADGNNQESSSEAINAWYGVYLWGKVTDNQSLIDTGLYLYNQEVLGAKYYWFDIRNLYTSPYNHAIGSIIWGGKIDFATWFSANINMKYGIELLPFTPGSSYLGSLPSFTKYQNDYFQSGGNVQNPWGDLFLMWESFYDSKKAFSERNLTKNHESNVPESLFLYQLMSNAGK